MERDRAGVLVVADHESIRAFLEEALTFAGYDVRTAADGAAGLAILGTWRPDAIVLDLVTPGSEAATFRAAQLALREVAGVPVLLLSAARAAESEHIARDLGAAAWLPKPFDLDALLAAVARLTGR
jgi:DNA-binding response OmpR family regulator